MANSEDDRPPVSFIANIPVQIKRHWDPRYAHLEGFPLNLMYSGLRASESQGAPRAAAACYWFAPDTYREDEQRREMQYYPREESAYYVRVTTEKSTGVWETFKYRGDQLIRSARGSDFKTAMMQTTLVGLESDEPESDLKETVD